MEYSDIWIRAAFIIAIYAFLLISFLMAFINRNRKWEIDHLEDRIKMLEKEIYGIISNRRTNQE